MILQNGNTSKFPFFPFESFLSDYLSFLGFSHVSRLVFHFLASLSTPLLFQLNTSTLHFPFRFSQRLIYSFTSDFLASPSGFSLPSASSSLGAFHHNNTFQASNSSTSSAVHYFGTVSSFPRVQLMFPRSLRTISSPQLSNISFDHHICLSASV